MLAAHDPSLAWVAPRVVAPTKENAEGSVIITAASHAQPLAAPQRPGMVCACQFYPISFSSSNDCAYSNGDGSCVDRQQHWHWSRRAFGRATKWFVKLTELFYLSFYLSFFPFPLLGRPPPVLLVNGVAVFANFICSHRCFVEGIPAEWCRLADINITR